MGRFPHFSVAAPLFDFIGQDADDFFGLYTFHLKAEAWFDRQNQIQSTLVRFFVSEKEAFEAGIGWKNAWKLRR